MSIALLLAAANGALYANAAKDATNPSAPALVGFIEFSLDDKKDGNKLRLEAAAWPKEKDGKKFYSLSAGGINATLFPETEKKNANSPDYSGSFGFNRELRIAGWKKLSDNQVPYISISVQERQAKNDGDGHGDGGAPAGAPGGIDFL